MSLTNKTPIEDVELPGVSGATIKKMKDNGIQTLEMLAVTPVKQIAEITGMSPETADKVSKISLNMVGGFKTSLERMEKSVGKVGVPTGIGKLDAALGNGLETGVITEVIGGFGSGKTQICFTAAVLSQVVFPGTHVFVVDTENTFKDDRLKQICDSRGLDSKDILSRIHVAEAYNTTHQKILIDSLPNLVASNPCKLVIVDSVIGNFRNEFIGRGTLSDRQQKLGEMVGKLFRLSMAFDLAMLYTNQMVATPDTMYGDPNKPAGGHVLGHAGTHRLQLRKKGQTGNVRIAKILDSPNHAEMDIPFQLTESGTIDYEEKD